MRGASVLAIQLFALSCVAPEVRASREDASAEAATDAAVDGTVLPDGRVCSGPDEERDGIPDDCDTCPNVHNYSQIVSKDPRYASVGAACRPNVGYEKASARLFFDPFHAIDSSRWNNPNGAVIQSFKGNDVLNIGTFVGTGEVVTHVFFTKKQVTDSTVVVTAYDAKSYGGSSLSAFGVIARAGGTPFRFIACYRTNAQDLAIAVVSESGCKALADCPLDVVKTMKVEPSESFMLRLSVSRGATSGTVQCRSATDAENDLLVEGGSTLDATLEGTQWLPSGEIGLFVNDSNQAFGSVDVLAEP